MAENTKKWDETGRRYRSYIKLEKRLSENTVESYMRDYMQFAHFILAPVGRRAPQGRTADGRTLHGVALRAGTREDLAGPGVERHQEFLQLPDDLGQDRIVARGVRPDAQIRPPAADVLTTAEIDRIIAAVDTSTVKGLRDCAMLEVLYSCGLRVSELTSLRMQDLFFGEGYTA